MHSRVNFPTPSAGSNRQAVSSSEGFAARVSELEGLVEDLRSDSRQAREEVRFDARLHGPAIIFVVGGH